MPSILIVDDEPIIREALAQVFALEGFAVRTADDGAAALAMHDAEPADVILSDVSMPHLGGDELVLGLRERGDATPVLLMTAASRPNPARRALCLAKPFNLDDVVDAVNALLDGRG